MRNGSLVVATLISSYSIQAAAADPPAAAEAPVKRSSLAASPVTRGGQESAQATSGWQTDFHGYFRVPMRVGVGTRPAPKASSDGKQAEPPVTPMQS